MDELLEEKEVKIREYSEDDYKEFFEWLLERDIHMNHMIDITLLDTHKEPKVYYPDEIKNLLETEAMQRLKRVAQLGSSLFENEDYYQTRFLHSVGAGNNAQKFYIRLFKGNPKWKRAIEQYGKKEEILADIIQMYTHDIGHNVLSHTLESLIKSNNHSGAAHEILGKRILNEDQEIADVFMDISPTFLKTLNSVTSEKYDLMSLKEGSIDFDRLDYLIRDTVYYGDYENRYITEQLLENYDIVIKEEKGKLKQIPVFNVEVQDGVKDFLERRAKSYQNNYFSNQSLALDRLAIYFCKKIATGNYDCDLKKYIIDCIQNGGDRIDLEEFKKWDDTRYYDEVIRIAQNHPDSEMRELAMSCLPSLTGLTNFVFEAYNLDHIKNEDELDDYQKEFFYNVRDLVKSDSQLHRRLLAKKSHEIVFLDAENVVDIPKVLDELKQAGIDNHKLKSLISWNKKIKIYNPQEPVYLKNSKNEIHSLDDYKIFDNRRDNIEVSGILALPMQMKENGFTDEEIGKVQNQFLRYNLIHKKTPLEQKNDYLFDVLECANNLIDVERNDKEIEL